MALHQRLLTSAAAWLVFALRFGCAAEATACAGSAGVSACSSDAHGSDALPPASLLQRRYKSVERHGFVHEEAEGAECTGVVAQGRCWYLSNTSESCGATCARHGQNFSYVAADTSEHVTQKLVGHDPVTKQHAWVAFECYVPSEDRYHFANANAAKLAEDLSSWSHESCKLACPCGNASSNIVPPGDAPKSECQWRPAANCVQEFDYKDVHYVGCTAVDHDIPWCSNTNPYGGSWSNCAYSCAITSQQAPVSDRNRSVANGTLQCTWKQRPACAKSFTYKGVNYTGCSDVDHPSPWCSYDRIHKGNWTTCERVCTPAVLPTASPTNASEDGAPCDRHPEHENDAIGNMATLDAEGYKIAVATDSAINMKRFVCRVVEKINCRVIDYPSLMAFVPNYLGSVIHETYEHLEAELRTLCHAGGKWVLPVGHP